MILEEDAVYEAKGGLRSRKLRRDRGGERDRGIGRLGCCACGLRPPEGDRARGGRRGRKSKRIDTALWTHDRAVLTEYGRFNAAMKRARKLENLPEARVTEGVSIDDLLDVAGRRCCAAPEETG